MFKKPIQIENHVENTQKCQDVLKEMLKKPYTDVNISVKKM